MDIPVFYRDKPVFGFDIGHDSIKMMQIDTSGKQDIVRGYGHINFDEGALKNGIIVNPEVVAKEVYKLITKHTVGSIDTRRVVASLPIANTFNRILSFPEMDKKDLDDAVRLEAEQYIPMPIDELYLDYEVAHKAKDGTQEILLVATPRNIVDSYLTLFELLNLEVSILETSIGAVSRMVMHAERTGIPTLIIDFGSVSSDLTVYDTTIRVTGTTDTGGETITKLIADKLGVTPRQAYTIKTRYGLNPGKKQKEIAEALDPFLKKLNSEIKKMIRFYEDRASDQKRVEQVIILGGGANLPGLSAQLTDQLRLPVRLCDPWQNLSFGDIQPPHALETTLYTTAAGLSLANPRRAIRKSK